MPTNVPTSLAVPRFIGSQDPQVTMRHIREILATHNSHGLNLDAPWLDKVFSAYQQPHRYFHTLDHLRNICDLIHLQVSDAEHSAQMLLAALFHDVVWYPQRKDNEEQSAQVFDQLADSLGAKLPKAVADAVHTIILTTKSPFIGKTLRESHLREDYGCMVVGVEEGQEQLTIINPDRLFESGDIVWLVGEEADLARLMAL